MQSVMSIVAIHKGEMTQTQLQLITLTNFSTMNAIVSRPAKPIPPVLLFIFDLLGVSFTLHLGANTRHFIVNTFCSEISIF